MHRGEDLDRKVLSMMMRHLNILKYFSFGIQSLDLNYSGLAGTLLTVITEMFSSEGQRV